MRYAVKGRSRRDRRAVDAARDRYGRAAAARATVQDRAGTDGAVSRRGAPRPSPPAHGAHPPYTSRAMQITTTPGPKSTIVLEVEVPAERLTKAIDAAVRRLSRQTRVPGFRPGKAPRAGAGAAPRPAVILDEAVEHLVEDTYREAVIEEDILPLTNPDVEVVKAEEGSPLAFKATVQVRPEVALGDYKQFNFSPEIETIDDARVDQVLEELRDQNATLTAVEGRGAKDGDYAVISFSGSRDGEPFEGGSSERMPLILGQERLIPGFEANLVGLEVGGSTEFDITFPDDYPERRWPASRRHFAVELRELREKVLPDLDADFVGSLGDFADVEALRADIKARLERNALDRARHGFADRIIEYAVANATLELPDVLVDQEVEVMHDEFRAHARPAGHHRGGVSEGPRQDRCRPARRVPAGRREAGQDPARPVQGGRRRGRDRPRRRGRCRGRPRPRALRRTMPGCRSTSTPSAAGRTSAARCAAAGSSRVSSTSGWPPIPEHAAVAASRGRPGVGRRGRPGRRERVHRRDGPGLHPRRCRRPPPADPR